MGTNYYLIKEVNRCECCGRADELSNLHIGKSAGGWAFALRIYPDDGINSLDDWKQRWNQMGLVIRDSYGKQISPDGMLDIVTNRAGSPELGRRPTGYADWADFHRANHSYRGPHDLLFSTYKVVQGGDTFATTYQLFDHEFC